MGHRVAATAVALAILSGLLSTGMPAAAQSTCSAETEPNDTEADLGGSSSGPLCLEGALPPEDQDLLLWEVRPEDAATSWDLTLEGVPGVLTILQLFPVESPPGQSPPLARRMPMVELSQTPDAAGPGEADGVLLPVGRYLVGISRSDLPGGGEPSAFDYRFRIEPAAEAPAIVEQEPNDDATSANVVSDSFDAVGDLALTPSDVFAWEVTEPDGRWDLEVTVPLEQAISMELTSEDGRSYGNATGPSVARLYDLALQPGRYLVRLTPMANAPRPYRLHAAPSDVVADPEPNDDSTTAVPVTDGTPVGGRLATASDRDRFALTVPPADISLRDVRVIWRSEAERRLCLLGAADEVLLCRTGVGDATLTNLTLRPGRHVLEVSGPDDPADEYKLRVDVTTPAAPDFEAEPNDDVASATTIGPDLVMRGRGDPADTDIYRLRVTGDAMLWRVDLAGQDIDSLAWMRPNGTQVQHATVAPDRASATLTDLYLVPGEHWFSARVDGAEYTLEATALGPPDPDGEREPNGDEILAESYRIGQRKVGRVPLTGDIDVYRFTLAAPGRVRFTLAQPPDGAIDLRLRAGDDLVSQRGGAEVGSTLTWDLSLLPGDHLLELRPGVAGEGRYELTSERLDPFASPIDQEPNDTPAWARAAPPSLSWEGDAAGRGDEDWFELPALTSADPLRIELSDPAARVRLEADDAQLTVDREGDGIFAVADPPIGVPILMAVAADGPYRVQVSGGGLVAVEEPTPLDLGIAWELPDSPVAAYWTEPQRVEGSLRLTNGGTEELALRLETHSSHHLWSATLAGSEVTVGSGESVVVPVSVDVAPDAWADEAVLLSARAVAADGGEASGSTELLATADAPPVGTHPGWPLPDAILGGLDAAFSGFGAVPGNDVDPTWEPALYDGVAPAGGGFAHQARELPIELTVDLAGDAAVPVAGIILDPLARDSRLSDVPSRFELWLSADGVDWQPALDGRLSPLPVEQAFVLDAPRPARFARLRILARHGGGAGYVALGEWKVVAMPGTPLGTEPLNVADPLLRGHVVRMEPLPGDLALGRRMLDADPARDVLRIEESPAVDIVVGFHERRSALVERLEWVDPDASNAATRLDEVEVWTSTQTPLGPWTSLGIWPLSRAADGSVASFVPGEPTWARYVRLTGVAQPDAREIEVPAILRVIERAPDATYRSILGEWGAGSPAGPYELLLGPETVAWEVSRDAGAGPDDATPLLPGAPVHDRVEVDIDEDWYAIDVPPTMSGLDLVVDGRPTVGVALSLFDLAGEERPMAFVRQPDGTVRYQARVEPGQRYRLRVRQPPFSAVFTLDTSGSMGPFMDIVMQGMRTFAAEVEPGREAVMIVPFEDPPLLRDWEDDPYVLADAVNNMAGLSSSSGAEAGLLEAAKLLEDREGARAVLLVTDAVTSTQRLAGELWTELARARPIVFAVHIGAAEKIVEARALMQDWAASGGGHYAYPSTHGEMDRAFDRMATWLRRPALYSLSYEPIDLDPGSIAVLAPTDGSSGAGLAPNVGVELILDTSGSMRARLDGRRRIDIARDALRSLVDETLDDGVPVALRTFGGRRRDRRARCQTRLTVPLAPLDKAAMRRTIDDLEAGRRVQTPIGAALEAVAEDLAAVSGPRVVVLVTDGEETCGGDPAAAVAAMQEAGIDVTVNIVGFALEDEAVKAQMEAWAALADGSYFDASGADDLATALAAAMGAPIRVYGPDGEVYEGGTVGGGPIELDPGTYRVEVLSDPPVQFEEVVVGGGEDVVLELPSES